MTRYFSDLKYLHDLVADPEGGEFSDLEAAKTDARDAIRQLAAEHLKATQRFELLSVRIRAESGKVLAEVLTADVLLDSIAPAVLQRDLGSAAV
jgi:hypothetical protein